MSDALGPGLPVDLGGVQDRAVVFDLNRGWSWGDEPWGREVPAGSPLAPPC